MREYATARRRAAHRECGWGAGVRLTQHFLSVVPVPPGSVISGYHPIDQEMDVMPLLGRLWGAGVGCGLPAITGKRQALTFRDWRPGAPLNVGPYRIPEPGADAAVVVPSHVLVPLLAYDSDGYRLGYGGGYYDRSLRELRDAKPVLAIGIAYSEQQVDHVPHDENDERLDWIVTERGATPFNAKMRSD
jgi:5-formyltetrahydrofolate cyclo-ligase